MTTRYYSNRSRRYALFYCFAIFCAFFVYSCFVDNCYFVPSDETEDAFQLRLNKCLSIEQLDIPQPAVLIDSAILTSFWNLTCHNINSSEPIHIAVLVGSVAKLAQSKKIQRYLVHTYFIENSFIRIDKDKIVPRVEWRTLKNNLSIPLSPLFPTMLERSKLVHCKGMLQRKEEEKRANSQQIVDALAVLRDIVLEKSAFLYLEAGILLGWYRECNIIPHTTDVDVGILQSEYSDAIESMFSQGRRIESPFYLWRRSGKISNSKEITLKHNDLKETIDVFVIYSDDNSSWTGGVRGKNIYQYKVPRYEPNCATILMGQLFWVTCNVEEYLKAQYGQDWMVDKHSNDWVFDKSPTNLELLEEVDSSENIFEYV